MKFGLPKDKRDPKRMSWRNVQKTIAVKIPGVKNILACDINSSSTTGLMSLDVAGIK